MRKEPEPVLLSPQEIDALRRSVDRAFLERLFHELDGTSSRLVDVLSADPYEPLNNWKLAIDEIGRDFSPDEWAKKMGITPSHFYQWCEERGVKWGRDTAPGRTLMARIRKYAKELSP